MPRVALSPCQRQHLSRNLLLVKSIYEVLIKRTPHINSTPQSVLSLLEDKRGTLEPECEFSFKWIRGQKAITKKTLSDVEDIKKYLIYAINTYAGDFVEKRQRLYILVGCISSFCKEIGDIDPTLSDYNKEYRKFLGYMNKIKGMLISELYSNTEEYCEEEDATSIVMMNVHNYIHNIDGEVSIWNNGIRTVYPLI